MSDTDQQLVRRYARQHAEDAFAELVRRHLNLVYSAALRQVRSAQLAEEVAQSVFADLARQAERLAPDTILSAWLYQVTSRTAIDVVRREARRQRREQVAVELTAMNATTADWADIEPLLDEAMNALDDTDRTAVLLRYFENKSFQEVGQMLKTTEDAARKRLSRAIDRLREFFSKRGVAVGAGGLVVLISANAVQAAPVGLVAALTAVALAGTTITPAAALATTKVVAMTTLQKTIIATVLVVTASAGIYEARQAAVARAAARRLQQQHSSLAEQIQRLQSERDEAARKSVSLSEENQRLNRNTSELLKLRGEVTELRNRTNALGKLVASLHGSQSSTTPDETASSHPRATWRFAGYATPEAAFESMTFALSTGNNKAALESLVPEVRSRQEEEFAKMSEAEARDRNIQGVLDVTGFRILRTDFVSDDQAFLTVVTEGKSTHEDKIRMMRIQGEWKYDPRRFDPESGQYQ